MHPPATVVPRTLELEQALATMVMQLNTMDFTVFKQDVKGAADTMIKGTAFTLLCDCLGSINMHRARQHRGCDKYHSRIKKKSAPYSYCVPFTQESRIPQNWLAWELPARRFGYASRTCALLL